jgi:hypothetical protein
MRFEKPRTLGAAPIGQVDDDLARGNFEGGTEIGGALARVVVGSCFREHRRKGRMGGRAIGGIRVAGLLDQAQEPPARPACSKVLRWEPQGERVAPVLIVVRVRSRTVTLTWHSSHANDLSNYSYEHQHPRLRALVWHSLHSPSQIARRVTRC